MHAHIQADRQTLLSGDQIIEIKSDSVIYCFSVVGFLKKCKKFYSSSNTLGNPTHTYRHTHTPLPLSGSPSGHFRAIKGWRKTKQKSPRLVA